MKNNRFGRFVIIIIAIIILISAGGIFYYKKIIKHPFKFDADKVTLKVEDGQSLNDVFAKLSNQRIIANTYLIKYYIKTNNIDTNIKPGEYEITKDMNLDEFLSNLSSGNGTTNMVKVTIPEGYNIEEIASALESAGVISKDDFLEGVKSYKIPSYIKNDNLRKYSLEGFLFPDTYSFSVGESAGDIIGIMTARFENVINEIEQVTGEKIGDSKIDDIVTMASIIEKETVKDDERPKVSSVFYNRMQKNMKLQSCATVLYALGYHKSELSNEDIKVESPYNTYIVNGLPEGPIACPGKASIMAALHPDDTNYLFFISNDDGTHSFTSSDTEFMRLKDIRDGKNKK